MNARRVFDRPSTPEGTLEAGTLYVQHVHQVARWAERLAGPDFDLEDIVHEVFSIAHRQLAKFRRDSSVATWLFGITDNVVRHARRKERWRRWLGGSAEDVAGNLACNTPDPLRVVEREEERRTVYRLLDEIPHRDRQVLILFELEDLSADEVAALLKIKPANARLRRHRARARFLRAYRKLEYARAEKEACHAQSTSF